MLYQTASVELKSVRRNYLRKTSRFDKYVGTAFMILTAATFFIALLRVAVHV